MSRRYKYIESDFERWLGARYYCELILCSILLFIILYPYLTISPTPIHFWDSFAYLYGFMFLVIGIWLLLVICFVGTEYIVYRIWTNYKERRSER